MSRETAAGEASVKLLCTTFRLSRAAYYAEARRKRGEAPAARAARAGAGQVIALPRRPRYTASEVVLERIREVLSRETAAAWGVRKVWATLRQEGLRVSRKRVWALMRAHGLVLAREREPGETPRGHVAVPEPNRRLATDLTTVWTRRDGTVALVPTIDCGDRTAVVVVTKDQHGPAVLASVETKLAASFGSPEGTPDGVELRTDHGPQYTGADCEALCRRWGLLHTFAPVGRPTGNAVVERFIRTLKEELIWLRDWTSADELRAAVATWLDHYHHHWPHQALNWQTPNERRVERLGRLARAA
jgi:transposase InsO family protein